MTTMEEIDPKDSLFRKIDKYIDFTFIKKYHKNFIHKKTSRKNLGVCLHSEKDETILLNYIISFFLSVITPVPAIVIKRPSTTINGEMLEEVFGITTSIPHSALNVAASTSLPSLP